jgi:hypothetical protein
MFHSPPPAFFSPASQLPLLLPLCPCPACGRIGREREERREKPFHLLSPNCDVILEAVDYGGVTAREPCDERIVAGEGSDALEGPPVEHEELHPDPDKVVSFLAFHERGLGYPTHPFLLSLLNRWEVELQHLNPNRVLHIAGFITLCEGFLGIDPYAGLFRAFFLGRSLNVKRDPLPVTFGGFRLQKRSLSVGDYSAYTPTDSNRGWREKWFYIRNSAGVPFPVFTGARPVR